MVRVALTGGIATGKSAVLAVFRRHGIPTIDADILAREVVAIGGPAYAGVVARFGTGILDDTAAIDRRALAAIVFADPAARRDLEAIVHPAVYDAIEGWFAALPETTPLAVADIPLLFETGRQGDFDTVVVVACPPQEQVRRVMARDGATEAEAQSRLAAQWPIDRKVASADHVIWTSGTRAETERQVEDLLASLGR
jgi:dephospho-CoA kinase